MKILYIDTSSSYLYTGIVDNGKLLAEYNEKLATDLSKLALVKIKSLFDKLSMKVDEIDKIIVVNGPGSFTGIRVGLTIAKVYAWSLNIPITTITSLEAMATSCELDGFIVPLIDARRGYVYAAIYDNNKEILRPQYMRLSELMIKLKKIKKYIFVTNNELELSGEKCYYNPDIVKIVTKYYRKDSINPHAVNPEYLKLTEAEESRL